MFYVFAIIGAVVTVYRYKAKKGLIDWYLFSLAAAFGYLSMVQYLNDIEYILYSYIAGSVLAYGIYGFVDLIVGAYRGKDRNFDYHVFEGVVQSITTTNQSGAVATTSKGFFGNDVVHVKNYSNDYDTLNILGRDGAVRSFTDVDKKEEACVGDEVIVILTGKNAEYGLYNKTRDKLFNVASPSKLSTAVAGLMMLVPVLTQFIALIFYVAGLFIKMKGLITSSQMHFEKKHVAYLAFYQVMLPFWLMTYTGSNHFALYYIPVWLAMPFVHLFAVREDYLSFEVMMHKEIINRVGVVPVAA